jgi:microsomal dipeptidase-like Zn-dependent dipeptidase
MKRIASCCKGAVLLRICNFHADTPCRLYQLGVPFEDPVLEAGAYAHLPYRSSFEIYAFFSEKSLGDEEAWGAFFRRLTHFTAAVARCKIPRPKYLLAVEDARLLAGKLERLKILRSLGVRILTLVWGGESIIGGAHDTKFGLSPFGRKVVEECFRVGIVPDVSHASDRLAAEVLEIAASHEKPVLASHSNFRSLCDVCRNQSDLQYLNIAALGGVSGISMCPAHLSSSDSAGIDDVVRQVEHGFSLDRGALVFGTDFDGISSTPERLGSTSALPLIADRLLAKGYGESAVDGLFFGNGLRFLKRAFPDLHIEI